MVTAVDAGEPAYKISVSNGGYGLQALRKNNWDGIVLANSLRHYKMVYFVESKDFAQAIKEDRENFDNLDRGQVRVPDSGVGPRT